MNAAFPPVSRVAASAPVSSPLGPHLVAQTKGDPNFYATTPVFDARGFWHSDGTNPPTATETGHGKWVHQGTSIRNGQHTNRWVWYPPKTGSITVGGRTSGNFEVSRSPMSGGTQLFSGPDYWARKVVVQKTSYVPAPGAYTSSSGIVPVIGTFACKQWALVASAPASGPWNVPVQVSLKEGIFNPSDVFWYYMKYVGASPYFTYANRLFKFEVDSHTLRILLCTDGIPSTDIVHVHKGVGSMREMFALRSPGDVTGFGLTQAQVRAVIASFQEPGPYAEPQCVPCTASNGGIAATAQSAEQEIRLEGCGAGPGPYAEPQCVPCTASNGGIAGTLRSAEQAIELEGLGRTPAGLGQFPLGPVGAAQLHAISGGIGTVGQPSGDLPIVFDGDWVEVFPSDPKSFQKSTNLGGSPINFVAGVFSTPLLNYLINQIQSLAPYATMYWRLSDPNPLAAMTLGDLSGLGTPFGTQALLRTSYPGNKLKIEIAIKTAASPMQMPNGISYVSAANAQCTGGWLQVFGPTGGNVAGSRSKLSIGLQDAVIQNYLDYITQQQFLSGNPASTSVAPPSGGGFGVAKQLWVGAVPYAVPKSVPNVYFSYAGQLYIVGWIGGWTAGQNPRAPASGGPSIELCTTWKQPALPAPSTPTVTPIAGFTPGTPGAAPATTSLPVSLPGLPTVPTAGGATVVAPPASGGLTLVTAPGTLPTASVPASAPSTTPTWVYVVGGLLGVSAVGALAYYAFEG